MVPHATPLEAEPIKGVFSAQLVTKIGAGSTTRRTVTSSYFYAQENERGEIEIQALNSSNLPNGSIEIISKEKLLTEYTPEPEHYLKVVYPKLTELTKTLARADRHFKRGETYSAEMEYCGALRIDEENVRANFGIGLCYLARGEMEKAEDILYRLVCLDAAFEPTHKHMFNEFGIALRKAKMFAQAADYYSRALDFAPDDENLRLNLARACLEKGDFHRAREEAGRALEFNPDLDEARKLVGYLDRKGLG